MQTKIQMIIQSFCVIYLPHVVKFEITDYYKCFLSISNLTVIQAVVHKTEALHCVRRQLM